MEHGEHHDHDDMEKHDKAYGGYNSILRQRLSSTSSDSGVSSLSCSPLGKMWLDPEEVKIMANPEKPIPLHWKSIPMPWK